MKIEMSKEETNVSSKRPFAAWKTRAAVCITGWMLLPACGSFSGSTSEDQRVDSRPEVVRQGLDAPGTQTIIDRIPGPMKDLVRDAKSFAQIFSNVKDAYSAGIAALQALGIINTPEPPATLSQIRKELEALGSGLDWKITEEWSARTYGIIKASMDATKRCSDKGNCATDTAAWVASDNAAAALYALTDYDMAYFKRYYNESATDGEWREAIDDPPTSNNYVYDWRNGIPHYLNFLRDRIVIWGAMDPQFSSYTYTFDQEITAHRDALQRHYDTMMDGVKCTYWNDQGPQPYCPNPEAYPDGVCPYSWFVYIYCADIYTGTYIKEYVGEYPYVITYPDSADITRIRDQLYDKMPLVEIQQMIRLLSSYLSPWTTPAAGDSYVISNAVNACVADVYESRTDDGTPIILWEPYGGINQAWQLNDAGNNLYTISTPISGKCMDVTSASLADGAMVIEFTCHGGDNQKWQFEPFNGLYRLVSYASGKCLDVDSDGLHLVQKRCSEVLSQQWWVLTL